MTIFELSNEHFSKIGRGGFHREAGGALVGSGPGAGVVSFACSHLRLDVC